MTNSRNSYSHNLKSFDSGASVVLARRIIEEIESTNLLQTLVDFGNSKVYESFELKLDLVDFRQKIKQGKKVQPQQQQDQQQDDDKSGREQQQNE